MSKFGEGPWAPISLSVKPEQSASPPQGPVRVETANPDAPRAPALLAPNSGTAEASPPAPPVPSLASLLDQARAAQAELAGQPLPITNHHHRFIMNLFGG